MPSRRWSGCQLRTVTARGAPGPAATSGPVPARLRSVTANVPGVAAVSVCDPAPRLSVPPGEHSRTGSGRYWLSSPIVPLTDVWYTRPSTVRAGPWPHAAVNLACSSGVTARSPARAGTESRDILTGTVSS